MTIPNDYIENDVMAALCNHELKIDQEQFAAVISGNKCHEVRVFDRNFSTGDLLFLRCFDRTKKTYNGDAVVVRVTNITRPETYGLPANIGVMTIHLVEELL